MIMQPIYVWIAAGGRCAPLLAAITRCADWQISQSLDDAGGRQQRHLVRLAPDESMFLLCTRGF